MWKGQTLVQDATLTSNSLVKTGSTIKLGSTIKTDSVLQATATYTKSTYIASDTTITADLTTSTVNSVVKSSSTIKTGSTLASGSSVTSDKIEVTVRNSGSVDTTISTLYVKTPEGDQWRQDWTSDNVIARTQTKKFVFTTLNSVTGSSGASVDEASSVPFGWKLASTYSIKVVTNTGVPTEASYLHR